MGTPRNIVVMGASAGGVEALQTVVAGLPRDLPAAVFVVLHVMPGGTSVLASILQRATRMIVTSAADGESVRSGHIYVAVPDHDMLIEGAYVRLTYRPLEAGHQPGLDPLFRSAARSAGSHVVGVVLSGSLDDGTDGLRAIAAAGGLALAQAPEDARFPSMPESALAHVPGARAVGLDELADAICEAVAGDAGRGDGNGTEPVESH